MSTMFIDAKVDEIIKDSSGSIVIFNYVCPCCQSSIDAVAYFNGENTKRMDNGWGFYYECDECKAELFLNVPEGGKGSE